jgi:deoxyribose-phosphate aldolase
MTEKLMAEPIARTIDHTLLAAEATFSDIERLAAEAREHGFAAICINPCWVRPAAPLLHGTEVHLATVCGFPLGATTSEVKAAEARAAAEHGANEVDMVMALGRARAGEWAAVEDDVAAVADALSGSGAILKVILECGLLEDDEKVEAARRSVAAGAQFVKTSTGFLAGGATVHDVALLRRTVGRSASVKASGGIRSLGQARAMLAAGADRLGTSSGVAIVGAEH